MPDRRAEFVVSTTSPQKSLRSRHYPTFQPVARFVALKVTVSSRGRHAKCRPQIETLHVDTKVNPHLHDFDVKLVHGHKISYFRIFLKRGKRIVANLHPLANGLVGEIAIMRLSAADGFTLINSRTTDGPVMDFVLSEYVAFDGPRLFSLVNPTFRARARIQGFQEPKRNALPKLLKISRPTAFHGPP
ncbi:hypothetical protein DFH06DRAFT_1127482 [Mycena polygramma]|nr:hypothetical protein DFH06DRAFT_1127482 [Mycena polygramma]